MAQKFPNVIQPDHIMIRHYLTLLRPDDSSHNQYRQALNHVCTFLTYEAFKTMEPPRDEVDLEVSGVPAPNQAFIVSQDIVIIAMMRGGMAPAAHLSTLFPRASVAQMDVKSRKKKGATKLVYERVPKTFDGKKCLIIAPRIETGAACKTVLKHLRKHMGADRMRDIIIVNVVCAPEGAEALLQSFPEISIVTASIEHGLSSAREVIPGIGRTGERVYQTVNPEDYA